MKSHIKSFALSILAASFCFLSIEFAEIQAKKQGSPSPSTDFSSLSIDDFNGIVNSGKINIVTFNYSPSCSLRSAFDGFSIAAEVSIQLFHVIQAQYLLRTKDLLIRLSNSFIIFPFHYFW